MSDASPHTPADRYEPDALDRALIAQLRIDGRAPLAKLAAVLGVARGTVQSRLDRLTARGILLGFTVRLRENFPGDGLCAVMLIEVVGKATDRVISRLHGFPEITALATTNGRWDLVAEVRAPDLGSFDRLLRELRMIDGVLNSETCLKLTSV